MPEPLAQMPQKIVALLTNPETVADCLDCACRAVEGTGARLEVLHVGFDPAQSLADPEESDMRVLRDLSRHTGPEARRQAVRAAFDRWAAGRKAAGQAVPLWNDAGGDVETLVARAAEGAGLMVMARPRRLDGRDALHGVLFRARKLLLLAPVKSDAEEGALTRHIVVGWKAGTALDHALAAAAPWLDRAERITLLSIAHSDRPDYASSARIWGERTGRPVQVLVRPPEEGMSVGRQWLSAARALGASAGLIGAFQRGALWESLLGGVTRDVLASAELPVFMMN